ncbi:ANTAR domain-containing protein [Streptomyces sp. NPDC002405]|uniref:ANTAR domain-containing protein n=1 Tax=unclassified Streptomyces TaxID=2593676 RepID=UPI00367529A3
MVFFAMSERRPLPPLSAADLVLEHERLHQEIDQLQRALTSHAVIDQAIGAVVTFGRIPPEDAWQVLREVSQRSNTKLRTVAEHVLKFAQGGALPDIELEQLRRALGRYSARFSGGRSQP